MPELPPDQSTTTTRRSPDVVGSRPPRLDRGRALRRAAVVLALIVAVVLVVVLRSDDDGPTFTGPSAGDPVTALCRSASEQQSAACSTAFFACSEQRDQVLRAAGLRSDARPREIAAGYTASAWSDWDAPVQRAARRGCRKGLGR